MSSKKNKKATTTSDVPVLKIGSRVRCTDDGVLGKITWANAVSVKIRWDDGEMVTWRRDELPGMPIEILSADDEPQEERIETRPATAAPEQIAATEVAPAASEALPAEDAAEPIATELQAAPPGPADEQAAVTPAPAEVTPSATEQPQTARATTNVDVVVDTAKPKRQLKVPAEPKEKKVSALDAARVLVEAGTAMTCKELIGVMAAKGYWSSPSGQTSDATLCSAILRELKVKGEQARFVKVAPGRFAARPTA